MRKSVVFAAALCSVLVATSCAPGFGRSEASGDGSIAAADTCTSQSLRLSHQWPAARGEDSDFRSQLAEDFSERVSEATDGEVNIKVFANSTLSKPNDQYDAMLAGSIDGAVMPLDYAAGHVPEWSISLMPGLVRSHDEARAWDESEIGEALDRSMLDNELVRLVHVWNAGGIGAQSEPILTPDDVPQGATMRAAGAYVEYMLQDAGAGITSLPSSEIYSAMQTGVLDAAVTSASSFASYRLEELVTSYVSPTQNTFWFMYEPLVLTVGAYEQMCAEQQEAVQQVADELQERAYSDSEADDARVETIFADAGVDVVQMDDAAFEQWLPLARDQWDAYRENVPGGGELMDLAQKNGHGK
ncbi:TRAP transporter substrate-binding protein DctP [Brevibacterium yomogidense]|uniref:TRAP transporter substrate-binding protein DctP n=1 Tax=Brevibacterium yomogidense TaxID=946573 RepID=UPI002FCCF241